MASTKNARKRQRQRRQKARAKAKKQAVRQSVASAASRPAPTRRPVSVAPRVEPRPVAELSLAPPPIAPPPIAPPPIGVDPPRPRDRRRIIAGVAAAVVSAVALVGGALLVLHPGSGEGRAERVAATPYTPPRPVAPNTSYVETRVLSSGDLRVTHWIDSRKPVEAIRLVQPEVGGLPSLEVSQVVVVGDATRAIRSSGGTREYYLSAARHVYVSYTLSGAVTRASRPAGRGLAVITNLEVRGLAGMTRTTHSVVGARVLNLACSEPTPEALPVPCGETGSDGWQATLDGASVDDRVMAQLDLGDGSQ